MTEITVAELEDKDIVYLLGISPDLPPAIHEWVHSDEFEARWRTTFDEADYLLLPADLGDVEINGVEITEAEDGDLLKVERDE